MATKIRTWWEKQFLEALESFTDAGRLARGRAYSSNYRLKEFEIERDGLVFARVRGNKNPYYGVYEEPTYTTTIEFQPISRSRWNAIIAHIALQAGTISKLMMNEIPDDIEESFIQLGLNLLPRGRQDCITSCTCPDYSNPCKHVAGVYYRVAQELDRDPFLLFELRGLSRDELKEELAKSPLGQALTQEMGMTQTLAEPVEALFTRPQVHPPASTSEAISLRSFWQGEKRFKAPLVSGSSAIVPGILIKKQGDFPAFWSRENSFIEAMEEFYNRVRTKNQDVLE